MQLALTRDEEALLVEVLQESALSSVRRQARDNLITHVLGRDLAFAYDELEDLSDFLADVSRRLHDEYRRTDNAMLQRRQQSVQRILDKVIEAEAMV